MNTLSIAQTYASAVSMVHGSNVTPSVLESVLVDILLAWVEVFIDGRIVL